MSRTGTVDDQAEEPTGESPSMSPTADLPEVAVRIAGVVLLVALLITSPTLTAWRVLDVVEYVVAAVVLPQLFLRASWSMVAVAGIGVVVTAGGVDILVGLVLAGLIVAAVVRRAPVVQAVSGTAVLVVAAFDPFGHGTWATGFWIALLLVPVVFDVAFGPRSRHSWQRRMARGTLVVGAVLLGLVGLTNLSTARAGNSVRTTLGGAIDAARNGDIDVAAAALDASAGKCAVVHRNLSGVRGLPLRLLPGLGAYAGPSARFGALCTDELHALAGSVSRVRAALKSTNKQYDLQAVAGLETEISLVRSSLWTLSTGARELLDDLPLPRVPASVERRLDDIDHARDRLQTLKPLAAQLPKLLGQDGPRRYFLMFVTPAEARPLGGFMGNWAILRADRGKVEVEQSGRSSDLSQVNYGKLRLRGLKDYRIRYESWLRGGLTTPFDPDIWLLYTVTPDLPTAGQVVQQLAPQSEIGDIDGVVMVDIATMAHLLTITGPLEMPEFGVTLDQANAEKFLLEDQYRAFAVREVRVPFLQKVGDELTTRLLGDDIGFTKLISAMRPDIERGGVGAWLVQPDEEAAAVTAEIAPSFPALDGHDGFILSTTNRSPNKIDAFVQRTIDYSVVYDESTGEVTGHGHITLHNGFDPNSGAYHYESGNLNGDPVGSVRNIVCIHAPFPAQNNAVTRYVRFEYLGWQEGCTEVVVLAGETVSVDIDLNGRLPAPGPYCFVSRGQVTALADVFHLVVKRPDGSVIVDSRLDGAKPKWTVGPGCPDGP